MLSTNAFTPLLNLIFKVSCHKILLHNYSFPFNYSIALIRLMNIRISFILMSLVDIVIPCFCIALIIIFLLLPNNIHFVTILILILILSINSANSI